MIAAMMRELGVTEFRRYVDEPHGVPAPACWVRDQAAAICLYVAL